jgi:hypothetical protein
VRYPPEAIRVLFRDGVVLIAGEKAPSPTPAISRSTSSSGSSGGFAARGARRPVRSTLQRRAPRCAMAS